MPRGWAGGGSAQAVGGLGEEVFRGILPPGRPHTWRPWAEREPQHLCLCQEHLETERGGGDGGRGVLEAGHRWAVSDQRVLLSSGRRRDGQREAALWL